MTLPTNALCKSRFAKITGLLIMLSLSVLQADAQESQQNSVRSEEHCTEEPTAIEFPADAREISSSDAVLEPAPKSLIPQTETRRKPNLPDVILSEALKITEESSKDEPSESSKTFEPEWKPLEKLQKKSRFLKDDDEEIDDSQNGVSNKFHWRPAILQSLLIQGFQHSYALVVQEKTRRALKGKFFSDYWESVKGVRGWSDGNKFFTNYIAHPMQGGMTGFIFVQNHDRAKKQKFGESKQYWKDRFKAFVWSTAWSTNWELGPISQSSIGNVGYYGKQGYVDLVITPTVGTGWLLTEEALDRYVIRHLESKSRMVKMLARTFINPMRSVANLLRFKEPWYRDRPFGH